MSFFTGTIVIGYQNLLIHLVISWIGYKYLEAEISRESKEQLLNNLKEGVLILDEKTAAIRFKNGAVGRINRRLKDASDFSLVEDTGDKLVMNKMKFQLMDYRQIKNEDSQSLMHKLQDDQVPPIMMKDIIQGLLMSEDESLNDQGPQIYRIAAKDSKFLNSSIASEKDL